jgi:hypothetical protein
MTTELKFCSRQGTPCRPTQFSVQWWSNDPPLGLRLAGFKADSSSLSVAEFRNVWSYPSSLHLSVVLKYREKFAINVITVNYMKPTVAVEHQF